MKKLIVIVIALAIALPVFAAVQKATLINQNGDKVVVAAGSSEAQRYFGDGYVLMTDELGGFYTPDILGIRERTKTIAKTGVYATTTLTMRESGTTYLISATGTRITLPAVASSKGAKFRFIVNGALDTASSTIASAEGDNIEGSLIVAGAVVNCDAADYFTFSETRENLGDYVEIMSTGTYWVPLSSGILTAVGSACEG